MKSRPGTHLARIKRLRNRGDVAGLISELDGDDIDDGVLVRAWAARQLGEIGDQSATPALTRMLSDNHEDARNAAARALGKLRDPLATDALLGSLTDTSTNVRNWSAESLGLIGDRKAVAPLVNMLETAMAPGERAYAARALGRIGDQAAVDGLIAALEDEHRAVRWLSAEALTRVGDSRAIPYLEAARRRRRLLDGRPLLRAIRSLSSDVSAVS
jgi:HEAT repeat protein